MEFMGVKIEENASLPENMYVFVTPAMYDYMCKLVGKEHTRLSPPIPTPDQHARHIVDSAEVRWACVHGGRL